MWSKLSRPEKNEIRKKIQCVKTMLVSKPGKKKDKLSYRYGMLTKCQTLFSI